MRSFLTAAGTAAAMFLFAGNSAFAAYEKLLFTIEQPPAAMPEGDRSSTASRREAVIRINIAASEAETPELSIPLFDGKTHTAVRTSGEFRAMNDTTWRGKIGGDHDVVLTFKNGFVAGLIYTHDGVYEIVPRGDSHRLVELDHALFPECAGDVKGESSTENAATLGGSDSGDRIDVLVVYTTATKNVLGGDPQAQAHAQAAIDATNTAYLNSKIRQRVRLVHSQEFVYTETTSASTDLSNLRNNASIQQLRDTHKADLVAEISEVAGVCGIGYLMGAATGNPNNGFTVTARSCAVGNLSFAHELGHNMGSQHNPENGSGPTYPYGFGHYINGSYRTVMSYSDPCAAGCVRRPYFSNPNVVYLSAATGIEGARDNARSINNTADVISNYRYSGASITLSNYNSGDVMFRTVGRPLTWTSDNITGNVRIEISRDESTTWDTIIASTPNDGSERISFMAPATRRARIRIVSLGTLTVSDSSVANIILR